MCDTVWTVRKLPVAWETEIEWQLQYFLVGTFLERVSDKQSQVQADALNTLYD